MNNCRVVFMVKQEVKDLIQKGNNIRYLRASRNKSINEMAEYLGISRSSYVRIEDGVRDMRCFEAVLIAEYLNVPILKIMNVQEKPIISEQVKSLALQSGFHNWEVGNRFNKFAEAVASALGA